MCRICIRQHDAIERKPFSSAAQQQCQNVEQLNWSTSYSALIMHNKLSTAAVYWRFLTSQHFVWNWVMKFVRTNTKCLKGYELWNRYEISICNGKSWKLITLVLWFSPKLYIPSVTNTSKKLLSTAILADEKWDCFWQISL